MAIELKEPGREPERKSTDKTSSMLCPVCQVKLVMSDRQGVEIDYCPDCRGVWLDRGELDKIIERSAPDTVPQTQAPDPRAYRDDDDDYRSRGGGHHGGGKHGGGHGKHGGGYRRKSWLSEIFD